MIVYLDADCALDALIRARFINSKDWKQKNSKKYTVTFNHCKTKGLICFEVSVEGYVHRISALYIKNLERQYDVKLSVIVNRCVIDAG
ncbi:MAG: hypothetical protein LBG27_03310 [Spirochaetaceae bacterium]|jgi:ribosomal protein S8|nr:hypothetical protein [Spirochaetaceae bacterium]